MSDTVRLLILWQAGDRQALASLIERELPWIRERVRERLGPALRARAETDDFVQQALLEVVEYAPPFHVASREQFRGLLARIAENVLRDEHDRFSAYRRSKRRERPLPSDSALDRDAPRRSVARPSEAAERNEWEAWIRLGLALLDPEDRDLVLLRQWEGASFSEAGSRLGISADAARMRFHRALARLAAEVNGLRHAPPARPEPPARPGPPSRSEPSCSEPEREP